MQCAIEGQLENGGTRGGSLDQNYACLHSQRRRGETKG
jgi:hypothetical protein